MRFRIRKTHVLVAAFTAALCVPAAGVSSGHGLPTSIGKGEGSLNVIEWAAYTDPSFANKFTKDTGCVIHRKDAGSSNEMVALMRSGGGGGGGQYDLVSASGDASLRLIYGGDVQPVNVNLIPSWRQMLPNFRSPAHNTGACHGRRPSRSRRSCMPRSAPAPMKSPTSVSRCSRRPGRSTSREARRCSRAWSTT